jgi:hypothetical protein
MLSAKSLAATILFASVTVVPLHAVTTSKAVGQWASSQSAEVRRVAAWIVQSDDHGDLQFIIVDKVNARLFLFDHAGGLRASAPVLIGLAAGDDSPPDIGTRPLSKIAPSERVTPAGRFIAAPGEDTAGNEIIWIDYNAAVALHRVSDRKPGSGAKSRLERLKNGSAADRRISLGCVNVSTEFYDNFIAPTFGKSEGVIYILPTTRSAMVQFSMPTG